MFNQPHEVNVIIANRLLPHYRLCVIATLCVFTTGFAYAKQLIKPEIYYDYLPFQEVLATNTPINQVSASSLMLVNKIRGHFREISFQPTLRVLRALDNSETPVCALFKLTTPQREKDYVVSLPVSFLSTNRLFMRKDFGEINRLTLNTSGRIKSLSALFKHHPESKLIYWRDISYSTYIDEQIALLPEKNKHVVTGISSHGSLVKLLGRNRADFAILNPSEKRDYDREHGILELPSYQIEGIDAVSTGHLICNKSPSTEMFIDTVDSIMLQLYSQESFVAANTDKLKPKERILIVRAIEASKSLPQE